MLGLDYDTKFAQKRRNNLRLAVRDAICEGIGLGDYDDLYESKSEYIDDRGARHDINHPRQPDIDDAVELILKIFDEYIAGEPALNPGS